METEPIQKTPSDHDLTVTLVANVKTLTEKQIYNHQELKESIKDLKTNYSDRINKLEDNKTDKEYTDKVVDGFEVRMRILERYQDNLIGKLSIITAVVASAVTFFMSWLKTKI